MKIAIIGGGAAGLVAAITCQSKGNEVTIMEGNDKLGKKLLLTGNGRCNYFNDDFSIKHYHSNNLDILDSIITEDNKQKVLSFFTSIGIIPKIVNGYYYPVTNQATTIVESLYNEIKRLGIKVLFNTKITSIKKQDNFLLNDEYEFDKVIIATGSYAASKTGSDGLGYQIAKDFAHSIIKPLPALVQLHSDMKYMKDWSGIRSDVIIKMYENNNYIREEKGEIQLTDYGISGICVFQLSRDIVLGIDNNKEEKVYINFIPWLETNTLDYLEDRNKMMHNPNVQNLLDGLLNYKLVNMILKKNHINNNALFSKLSIQEKRDICNDLDNFRVNITGYNDFEKAQTCSGGIPLSEININTFESHNQSGLYFIGEILDVDGECGGFNLGFAWLSGLLVGEHIND